MRIGDTCLTVVSADVQPDALALLDRLDRTLAAKGWAVMPRMTHAAGDSADRLRARLAPLKPSHTLLFGDGVPWVFNLAAPEAHTAHDVPDDYWYVNEFVGCVGRVRFDNLPLTGKPSAAMYVEYLQKVLAFDEWSLNLGLSVCFLDYFAETPALEPAVRAARAQVPDAIREERYRQGTLPDNGSDQNFASWAQSGRLIALMFSGGKGDGSADSIDAFGLWNIGGPVEWLQYQPRLAVAGVYGSMQSDAQTPNAFTMLMLTTPGGPAVTFYNNQESLPIWKMLTEGWTAGEVGRTWAGSRIANVFGVPMLTFSGQVLTAAQILQAAAGVPAFADQVSKVQFAPVKTDPLPIASGTPIVGAPPVGSVTLPGVAAPVGIRIGMALYRQRDAPAIGKNVKAQVQAAIDGKADLYVYSDTQPCLRDISWKPDNRDPYPFEVKEVFLVDDAGKEYLYTQYAQIVRAGVLVKPA